MKDNSSEPARLQFSQPASQIYNVALRKGDRSVETILHEHQSSNRSLGSDSSDLTTFQKKKGDSLFHEIPLKNQKKTIGKNCES